MVPSVRLADALAETAVRYVVVGVGGANFHTLDPAEPFDTGDLDLLLPLDGENLTRAWDACGRLGLQMKGGDPERVVAERLTTRATRPGELVLDLSLEISAFAFDDVWAERRTFLVDGVEIPVARLSQIIRSKAATNREQDRRFLATHAERLRRMLDEDED